ncbi:MAG TPA: arsenate reductase ArsC [Candidatus Eisenbacteria bacterium]|nr:arsenate reductase ArsC [Candidatus Eisenbacteria bacterium]
MRGRKPMVLFLCADNSVRSQLAEALLRHHAGDRFECTSAGLTPKPVHPLLPQVLRESGVEPGALDPKGLKAFLGHGARFAIILRTPDETEAPRIFPFATRTIHWEIPDLGCDGDTNDALAALRHTRDEIAARLRCWLASVEPPTPYRTAA